MCAPHPITATARDGIYHTPRAALATAIDNGAVDAVLQAPPLRAADAPALPDTIAEGRDAIDREARGDIAFHAVLLAAVIAIIAAAILA